jgi:Kef-type K+ transport system membrane component KefB
MQVLDFVRAQIAALPLLAGFAISIAVLVGVPVLAKKVGFPAAVGLLVVGIALGPHALGFFEEERPIEDFFGELGVLLLMFSAGLEIDLPRFRAAQNRSIIFGILTTVFPLALGTLFGLAFDYALIPAIVIGSLLASHTLIALPTIADLGETRLEPIVVVAAAPYCRTPCRCWCLRFA